MRIKVTGSQPLRGTYRVSGSSNSAMVLIAASMLTQGTLQLNGVPDTISVGIMLEIAQSFGLRVDELDDGRGGKVLLDSTGNIARSLEREFTDALASSLLFLAPVLVRQGHIRLTIEYGLGRFHSHLTAMRDLGIEVKVDGTTIDLEAHPWTNREIILTQTSVTATALVVMLAAVLGQRTTIINAASEPSIGDLLNLLQAMGVRIEGGGSNLLTVYGNPALKSAKEFTVSPDYIEAASIAAMTALTGGRLTLEGTRRRDMRMIAKVYERLGVQLSLDEDAIVVPVHEHFIPSTREEDVDISVESAPWPGFPSDLIPMATVIATQAQGTVLIHEKLFSNRLLFVDKLNAMGAQIVLCDPHRAIVIGPTKLQADYIDTPDVRTGLAMLAAALCAEGETVIDTAEVFDRYFEHVLDKLIALGARIKRGDV